MLENHVTSPCIYIYAIVHLTLVHVILTFERVLNILMPVFDTEFLTNRNYTTKVHLLATQTSSLLAKSTMQ